MAFGGWGSFFAGIAGPIAKKVLTAIGVGVVTVGGVQAMITSALNSAKSAMGGMSGVVLDLVAMSGFFAAVAVIAGGLTAAGTLIAFKRLSII